MNNDFEHAFNFIIKHNYNTACKMFSELYSNEQESNAYLNGRIISLLLIEDTDALYSFLGNENKHSVHESYLNIITGILNRHLKPSEKSYNKTIVYNVMKSLFEALQKAGHYDAAELYLRTCRVLRPDDPALLKHLSEKAFKDGYIEKGCSYIVKAAGLWIKSKNLV